MAAPQSFPESEPTRTHVCPERNEVTRSGAGSSSPSPREWGESITAIVELDGLWWSVSGDPPEYSTAIAYCPWCGLELNAQP